MRKRTKVIVIALLSYAILYVAARASGVLTVQAYPHGTVIEQNSSGLWVARNRAIVAASPKHGWVAKVAHAVFRPLCTVEQVTRRLLGLQVEDPVML